MIFAICGIDSAGKATQVKKLAEAIPGHASTYDFPHYDTVSGQLIRHMLKNDVPIGNVNGSNPAPLILQSLMTVNRLEMQTYLVKYANNPELHIVLDRYYASGVVYGAADGLDKTWLINIHKCMVPADYWFYIDISVEESFRRRPEREDAYESRKDLLGRARAGYLDLFTSKTNPFHGKWFVIDGHQSESAVHRDIMSAWK